MRRKAIRYPLPLHVCPIASGHEHFDLHVNHGSKMKRPFRQANRISLWLQAGAGRELDLSGAQSMLAGSNDMPRKKRYWTGLIAALALCGAALSVPSLAIAQDNHESLDLSIYTKPQRLVEVEPGRRLNLVCIGKGSPTVVFDVGVGDPAGDWSLVQPRVASFTRACSYDRAGIGFSDEGHGHGSSLEIVDDLKRLLLAASIDPPYILVGQSYGGMNVRLYYYLHPDEVAGLVLVDPAHEDQDEGFRMLSPRALSRADWVASREPGRISRDKCIAAASRGANLNSAEFKECVVSPPDKLPEAVKPMWLNMQFSEKFQRAQGAEEQAVFAESVEQLRAQRRGFGALPVIVLSRSADERPLRDWETRHLRESRYQFWLDLHRGLADSSSNGEWRIVPKSDHLMMLSQPGAIVTAVRDVFTKVTGEKP
jgi:pimeloyl-ACP methyl ester carboxylesterase